MNLHVEAWTVPRDLTSSDEDWLQANARWEIDSADVPMSEQDVRNGGRTTDSTDRQVRLSDRVEHLSALFVNPCLECATHTAHVADRKYLHFPCALLPGLAWV